MTNLPPTEFRSRSHYVSSIVKEVLRRDNDLADKIGYFPVLGPVCKVFYKGLSRVALPFIVVIPHVVLSYRHLESTERGSYVINEEVARRDINKVPRFLK